MTNKDLLNRDPITDEPGSHPVGTGVGAASGALAGAAIGAVAGGPIGIIAGTMIGGIAGGLAGKEVAEANNPTLGGDREDNLVGGGVGASAGIMTGAVIGSGAGPIGTVVGAAVGAVAGGIAGDKVEDMITTKDEKSRIDYEEKNYDHLEEYPSTIRNPVPDDRIRDPRDPIIRPDNYIDDPVIVDDTFPSPKPEIKTRVEEKLY